MKTYTITAMRTEFLVRTVQANSPLEAEDLAYDTPIEQWKTVNFGDVEHLETQELKL
jgi:hypothetical protein